MTREMNKPDWHYKWVHREGTDLINGAYNNEVYIVKRELNPDIADFFWATCERFKQC